MRIVFFGTSAFAVSSLTALSSHVVGVITQPQKPSGRGLSLRPSPMAEAGNRLGIPVHEPFRSRALESIELFRSLDADLFVVAAYGQILSKEVLAIPRCGCFNLHGSVLPKWRGAAPIQRAIEAGDKETGVTLMLMDEGMDTGDMIAVSRTGIGEDETAGELYGRLAELAGGLAATWAPKLFGGEFPRAKQRDEDASLAKKVLKEHAEITANLDAMVAYNRFRAFTPSPGAFLKTASGIVKILECRPVESATGTPGHLIAIRPDLVVALQKGGIQLLRVQPEGRKPMSGLEFLNGARLGPGTRLLEEVPFTGE